MARPPKKLSKEQIAQVEALASVMNKEQIADYLGISRTTFNAIEARQPEVSERYKKGRALAIATIAKSLLQQAKDGNITAAIFYLKTQGGWRSNEQEVNLQINNSPTRIKRVIVDATGD